MTRKASDNLNRAFDDAARLRARDQDLYLGVSNDKYRETHWYGGPKSKNLHWAVFGGTGAGKDTTLIGPNMAHSRRSIFCVDVKGEQCALTARWRSTFSRVVVIDPAGVMKDKYPSHGFNCVGLPSFDPKSASDFHDKAVGFADSLIKVDGAEKHFPTRAKALVAGLIMWDRIKNPSSPSLRNMRRMLTQPYGTENNHPIGLLKTLIEMKEHGFEPMTSKTNSFLHPNNETLGVIATAIGQTDWLDGSYAEDVSKGPFDFAELKGPELVTVYVIIPATQLETHSIWLRLVVGACLRDLMRSGPGDAPPPLLILNEVGQLGYLEPLATGMNIARGYGCQIATFWNSIGQIKSIYKDNYELFLSARGCLSAYAPRDWETAEYVAKLCGYRTELMTSYNAKPGRPALDGQETPTPLPLFRPEDVMRLPPDATINLVEPVAMPMLLRTPGYWNTPWAHCFDDNPYYRKPKKRNTRPTPRTAPPRDHRQALNELKRQNRAEP